MRLYDKTLGVRESVWGTNLKANVHAKEVRHARERETMGHRREEVSTTRIGFETYDAVRERQSKTTTSGLRQGQTKLRCERK